MNTEFLNLYLFNLKILVRLSIDYHSKWSSILNIYLSGLEVDNIRSLKVLKRPVVMNVGSQLDNDVNCYDVISSTPCSDLISSSTVTAFTYTVLFRFLHFWLLDTCFLCGIYFTFFVFVKIFILWSLYFSILVLLYLYFVIFIPNSFDLVVFVYSCTLVSFFFFHCIFRHYPPPPNNPFFLLIPSVAVCF